MPCGGSFVGNNSPSQDNGNGPLNNGPPSHDWYLAIGNFFSRGRGAWEPKGRGAVFHFALELGDRYNFHRDVKNGATIIPGLRDDDFAQLHEVGLAKAYNRSGGTFYFSIEFENRNPLEPAIAKALQDASWYPWELK